MSLALAIKSHTADVDLAVLGYRRLRNEFDVQVLATQLALQVHGIDNIRDLERLGQTAAGVRAVRPACRTRTEQGDDACEILRDAARDRRPGEDSHRHETRRRRWSW